MNIRIITRNNHRYEIDEDGCFIKYDQHKWEHPHNSWKLSGIRVIKPFNNLGPLIDLNGFFEMVNNNKTEWKFKNGKPKYLVQDNDHGTQRICSDRIDKAYLVEE